MGCNNQRDDEGEEERAVRCLSPVMDGAILIAIIVVVWKGMKVFGIF